MHLTCKDALTGFAPDKGSGNTIILFKSSFSYIVEIKVETDQFSFTFQIIDVTVLNKLLGSLFDSTMLSDLLKILSEFFISDNVPVTGILKQIIINNEFKILKLMMDTEDKNGENV